MPPRMSVDEKRLVRSMHFEKNMTPSEIAKATGRTIGTICRNLARKGPPKPMGRKRILTKAKVDRIEKTLQRMIVNAKGEKEITMDMLRAETGTEASKRTIRRELHKRDVKFRAMREKPKLTPEDIQKRMEFATKYKGKSKAWWLKTLHVIIDLKNFPVYLTQDSRVHAARRQVRGAYRKKGDGLSEGYTAINKKLRHNPGAKSVMIAAGVGKGKVLMWHEVQQQWCGQVAADLYSNTMRKILKKVYPGRAKWTILEDNDPSGFQSKKAIEAKKASGMSVFHIPPRSPDLNVCDYALWAAVTRAMRDEEASWPKGQKRKRETREEYIARLSRAASSLPRSEVEASIADMMRRCRRLYEAKGGHFEEGGKSNQEGSD